MALDFPNSPTLNQTFTAPNGTIWLWDGVKWTATTSTSPFAGQGNVGRNLLHNPLFNVAQRGAGPWTTNGYGQDRWIFFVGLDTYSGSQGVLSDADRAAIGDEAAVFCLANTFTGNAGAASQTIAWQLIENVRRLSGKTVTVSFWAVAAAGTPKLGISYDQNFGTGGSPSVAVNSAGQAVTLSTTWTRYNVTFTLPSVAGKTFGTNNDHSTGIDLWYSAGTNAAMRAGNIGVQSGTVRIWGVQLEIGSVATPLEKPDPRYDLSNCQRFYCIGQGEVLITQGTAGGYVSTMMSLPTQMRANPTLTPNFVTQTNVSGSTLSVQSSSSFLAYATGIAAGNCILVFGFAASADL